MARRADTTPLCAWRLPRHRPALFRLFPAAGALRGPLLPAADGRVRHRAFRDHAADDGGDDRQYDPVRRRFRRLSGRVQPGAHGHVSRRRSDHPRLSRQRRRGALLAPARGRDVRPPPGLRLRLRRQRRRLQDHRLHRKHPRGLGRRGSLHPWAKSTRQPCRQCLLHRPGPRHARARRQVDRADHRRPRSRRQRRHVRRPGPKEERDGPGRGDPHGRSAAEPGSRTGRSPWAIPGSSPP